jgi:glutamate synthase (NADPH/NADH) small chain
VCKEGSETTLDVDTVIIAIGTSPNPLIVKTTPGLKTGKHGVLEVEPYTFKTSREGVFAGGDIVSGAATVISAMGQAKEAARAIDEYLRNKQS